MKRIYYTVLLLIVSFIFFADIMAQEKQTLTGQVITEEGPALGANVTIRGTAIGTITDVNGNYSLQVEAGDTIVISYIGYRSEEVPYTNQEIYNLTLIPDVTELEQVVVVGYGEVKKKDLTGAISVIRGDKLETREAASVQEVLQGQLAGVQVMSRGGQPGAEATILVRGISTINDNNPLYIVDGSPLEDIEFLNPKDIESVQVLKDASASAIYGSKASNGVIIIETKRAKTGAVIINFDASVGQESVSRKPEVADAHEYTRIANLAAENSGQAPIYPDPDIFEAGTDWWDEVMQNGLVQNYNLSLSKGTEDFKVTTGVNYFNQEGILEGGGYERYNFKLNTEFQLTPKIKIGENITIARSTTTNGPNVVWDAQLIEPITSVYRPEYEQEGLNEYSIYSPTTTDVGNPVAQIARNFYTTDYFRVVGNAYLEWDIAAGLKFKSQYNIYLSNWEQNWFGPDYFIEQTDKRDVNSVSRAHNNRINNIWENYLTYHKDLGKHSITALAGMSMESRLHKTLYGEGEDTPNNSSSLRFLSATTGSWQSVTWNGSSVQPSNEESTLLSYFGRLNYSFSGRYILAASLRADGSSKFPENNRWGIFPAVSGAWVISEESFMESQDWLNQLKIRAGWGQVGNQFFEDVNARYSRMGIYYTTMGANQDVVIGAAPSSIGNSLLKWETVEDINLGLDFSALNNKLVYSLDLYQRKSKDMILWTSVPGYMGFGYTQQLTNIGELAAKGYEMMFKYRDAVGEFRYELGFNLSSAKTRIEKLVHGESVTDGNHQRLDMLTTTMEGETAGTFYGYVTDGIFQNLTEINSHSDEQGNLLQAQAEPGDFRFLDINNDGILNDNDKRVIGNPEPDFTYGINGYMSYKGIDLSLLFTGSYGNDVLNAIKPYSATGEGYYNSEKGLLERGWNGENSTNTQPVIKAVDQNQNFRYSDYYIEDGSYIRLKNVQLAYNFPERILAPIKIKKAKIYISAENVYTFTPFSGLDPDMGGRPTVRGIDWGHYPLPKRFTIGLKLTL